VGAEGGIAGCELSKITRFPLSLRREMDIHDEEDDDDDEVMNDTK